MRVKDFARMYKGFDRIRVEIVNGVLRIFIRGCE